MIYILTITLCLRAVCIERFVETPYAFACDDPQYHLLYMEEKYPEWHFVQYTCSPGRYA